MPIDHTSIQVPLAKHAEVVAFYLAALEPLGYQRLMTVGPGGSVVGLGAGRKPDWWITGVEEEVKHRTHIAFTAPGKSFHLAPGRPEPEN